MAVDGKTVRGTRHASGDGQGVHLLAAAEQRSAAVLAQAKVDGKINEITCFAPLLEPLNLAGAVVTADALHAQRELAEFMVTKRRRTTSGVKNNSHSVCQLMMPAVVSRPVGFDARKTRSRESIKSLRPDLYP